MKKMKKKPLIVFLIFIVALIKYILINHLELIHPYGKLSGLISWCIILPLFIWGSYLVIIVLKNVLTNKKMNIIDILLILPFILFFTYFFLIK